MRLLLKLIFFCHVSSFSSGQTLSDEKIQEVIQSTYKKLNENTRFGIKKSFAEQEELFLPPSLFDYHIKRDSQNERVSNFLFVGKNDSPSQLLKKLFHSMHTEDIRIECRMASQIFRYQLVYESLNDAQDFDRLIMSLDKFFPQGQMEKISRTLVLGIVDRFSESCLSHLDVFNDVTIYVPNKTKIYVGDLFSIPNTPYYKRKHPLGSYNAENVIFYQWDEKDGQKIPLFFGYQGIFKDHKPHSLFEIQKALLEDYLRPSTEGEWSSMNDHDKALALQETQEIEDQINQRGFDVIAQELCQPIHVNQFQKHHHVPIYVFLKPFLSLNISCHFEMPKSFHLSQYRFLFMKGYHFHEETIRQWIAQKAETGDSEAECAYGVMLWQDAGGTTCMNEEKMKSAISFYKKSSEQGNPEAQVFLWKQLILRNEQEEAFRWLYRAVESGYPKAMCRLAETYKNNGLLKAAIPYYELASSAGFPAAQSALGTLYYKGEGVEKNMDKAFELYEQSAVNGDPKGQYNLGVCYLNGKGVEKNEKIGLGWIRLSAFQEYESARQSLTKRGIL